MAYRRITGRLPDGVAYVRSETGREGVGAITTQRRLPEIISRLAAYEDTELTPKQIKANMVELQKYRDLGKVGDLKKMLFEKWRMPK